jgi:hypothetical protein
MYRCESLRERAHKTTNTSVGEYWVRFRERDGWVVSTGFGPARDGVKWSAPVKAVMNLVMNFGVIKCWETTE